jgi:hypothetical protein
MTNAIDGGRTQLAATLAPRTGYCRFFCSPTYCAWSPPTTGERLSVSAYSTTRTGAVLIKPLNERNERQEEAAACEHSFVACRKTKAMAIAIGFVSKVRRNGPSRRHAVARAESRAAVAALRIMSRTMLGLESIGTWLLSTSMVVAPMRFAR